MLLLLLLLEPATPAMRASGMHRERLCSASFFPSRLFLRGGASACADVLRNIAAEAGPTDLAGDGGVLMQTLAPGFLFSLRGCDLSSYARLRATAMLAFVSVRCRSRASPGLGRYLTNVLWKLPGVQVLETSAHKAAFSSFVMFVASM